MTGFEFRRDREAAGISRQMVAAAAGKKTIALQDVERSAQEVPRHFVAALEALLRKGHQ